MTRSARNRVYGSQDRAAWMRALPCAICGRSPCEVAHTTTGGMGRKADAETTIPLCPPCHRLQRQKGWSALLLLPPDRCRDVLTTLAARYDAAWSTR